jgi:uncharacterized surface protein with fasciclin (FAS1) repeats
MTSDTIESRAHFAPLTNADGPNATGPRKPEHVRQPSPTAHDHDILTTAEGSRRLGIFVDYTRAAGLAGLLLEQGPFTVFAPTERAFLKLSVRDRDALLADPRRLTRVMRGHVVPGLVPSMTDASGPLTTIDGEKLVITMYAGSYRVGNARIVQANIPASNGIIHAIDSLLL